MTRADLARDSYGSWSLAIACLREQGVRAGRYQPRNEIERRQAAEGPVNPSRLTSVQSGESA
jgi:hypothetical protein